MLGFLTNNTRSLHNAMDASYLRGEVIQHNIANATTPGYKAHHVKFESLLQKAQQTSNRATVTPQVVRDESSSMKLDGNNVDIDREMGEQAKNKLWYDTLVRQLSENYGRLRMCIREGK